MDHVIRRYGVSRWRRYYLTMIGRRLKIGRLFLNRIIRRHDYAGTRGDGDTGTVVYGGGQSYRSFHRPCCINDPYKPTLRHVRRCEWSCNSVRFACNDQNHFHARSILGHTNRWILPRAYNLLLIIPIRNLQWYFTPLRTGSPPVINFVNSTRRLIPRYWNSTVPMGP